ncbi:TetR/AcrR family transcriptional regulator [Dactylosporangium siamense]|uniref:TetR family transcriptional regulator n=1 Tax=Dactylosporangium siamense TaxID=685454 RepID=A0A919PYQ5_9ACTN|nr:TetR/AcrR family transcriptional regulator [Dactylosporangium siamense]GIG52852.1 TetR family transcriptional regulator [Dactylosporangium siamense]
MTTVVESQPSGVENTRERLPSCALALFAEFSFEGTSLQMIADALGVTKAAVYHHFKTREDILLAVVRPFLADLAQVVARAEAARGRRPQIECMLGGFVDLAVHNRAMVSMITSDAGVTRALHGRGEYLALINRSLALITGPAPTPEILVAATMALVGIANTVTAEPVAALPEPQLRLHLLDAARRALGLRRRPDTGP